MDNFHKHSGNSDGVWHGSGGVVERFLLREFREAQQHYESCLSVVQIKLNDACETELHQLKMDAEDARFVSEEAGRRLARHLMRKIGGSAKWIC